MKTNIENFYSGDSVKFNITTSYDDESYNAYAFLIKEDNSIKMSYLPKNNDRGNFLFELDSIETDKLLPGKYVLFFTIENGLFKKTEQLSSINVFANVLNSDCVIKKSDNQIMLEIVTNVIKNRIKTDYHSYTIGNKQITKMSPEALLKLQAHFQEQVDAEENMKNGDNKNTTILRQWIGAI